MGAISGFYLHKAGVAHMLSCAPLSKDEWISYTKTGLKKVCTPCKREVDIASLFISRSVGSLASELNILFILVNSILTLFNVKSLIENTIINYRLPFYSSVRQPKKYLFNKYN